MGNATLISELWSIPDTLWLGKRHLTLELWSIPDTLWLGLFLSGSAERKAQGGTLAQGRVSQWTYKGRVQLRPLLKSPAS